MAEEQKMPETQAGTQPNGQQPAQEAPQPAADAPHSCPEEGPGQETTKEHKEHKPGKEALHAQLAAAQQKAEDLSAQLAQAKDTLMRTAAQPVPPRSRTVISITARLRYQPEGASISIS